MGAPQRQMGGPQRQMGSPQGQMGGPQGQMGGPGGMEKDVRVLVRFYLPITYYLVVIESNYLLPR